MSEQPYVPPSETEYVAVVVAAYKEGREEGFMEGFLSHMFRWVPVSQNTKNIIADAMNLKFPEFRRFHKHNNAENLILEKKTLAVMKKEKK